VQVVGDQLRPLLEFQRVQLCQHGLLERGGVEVGEVLGQVRRDASDQIGREIVFKRFHERGSRGHRLRTLMQVALSCKAANGDPHATGSFNTAGV